MKYLMFFLLLITVTSNAFAQSPPKITSVSITNIKCFGEATGQIIVSASGVTPFQYTCDDIKQSSNIFKNLKAGTHTFVVSNTLGSTKGSAFISQPNTPLIVTCVPENLRCNADTTGTISVKVSGGIPIYKYLWNNGSTDSKRTKLPAGNYSVAVTDSNGQGCTVSCSTTITEPPPLKIQAIAVNANCTNNGSVHVDTSGGTPPYTYSWSNGSISSSQSGLPPGNYTVTVTDANGCTKTSSVTLTQQGSSTPKYKPGDSISCGYIFYVDRTADSSHPCSTHYLVCAYKDEGSNITWYNNLFKYQTTNATTDILFDRVNAMQIDSFSLAASTCSAYRTDSCSNWYLPSKMELDSMYKNLASKNIGSFAKEGYWSSIEGSKRHSAWIVDFFNGREIQNDKSNKYHIRAVCDVWLPNN